MNKGDPRTTDLEKTIKNCNSTWGKVYYSKYYGEGAPHTSVHLDLITSMLDAANPKKVLDAGCGAASMLRHFVRDGCEIYGFDLTPEMVQEVKSVMEHIGVPESHVWEASILNPSRFFILGIYLSTTFI